MEDIGAAPDYVIGFGLYKITIASNSIYVDYRDCDYPDSYSNSDIWLYYNVNNGIFYKDANLSQPYDQDTVAIWEDGRKSSGIPTHTCFLIPVTVQNNFTGGQITVDGNTCSSPYGSDWPLNSSHSISAISPQNVGSGNYVWCAWSDAGAANGSDSASFSTMLHNYPNPFNPQTTIGYQLLEGTYVSLKVYDLRGQEVATLVEGWQSAGTHAISFDASKLTSGIYWYQLQAGNVSAIRKMVLLR